MRKKPNIDEGKLVSNPFVQANFGVKVRGYSEDTSVVSVSKISDGVILEKPYTIPISRVVEQDKYSKVYNEAGFRLHIMSMSSRARDLFLWITYELESGKDWLWINKQRYMDECTVSLNTYKGAIEDITKAWVITPTIYQDTYWINPRFIFNGSRINKYSNKLIEV